MQSIFDSVDAKIYKLEATVGNKFGYLYSTTDSTPIDTKYLDTTQYRYNNQILSEKFQCTFDWYIGIDETLYDTPWDLIPKNIKLPLEPPYRYTNVNDLIYVESYGPDYIVLQFFTVGASPESVKSFNTSCQENNIDCVFKIIGTR